MKTFLMTSIVLFTAACNSPGWVKPHDSSQAFKVADSIFMPVIANGEVVGGDILIADQPQLCEAVRSGFLPSRMKAVMFRVFRLQQDRIVAPDVGEYELLDAAPKKPGNYAVAQRLESDLNCKQTLSARDATLDFGDVGIEQMDTTNKAIVRGRFNVSRFKFNGDYDSGNIIEGAFSADYCPTPFEKFNCR